MTQDDPASRVAFVPQRERHVDFYGDDIPVAQVSDGTLYVPLRPITDFLGLAFSAQRRRILRDDVLAERVQTVLMTAADGRQRDQLCLPLDILPGWLFGVSPGHARPDLMEKLKRYRADCFRVLWQAFAGEAGSIIDATKAVVPIPSADAQALEHIAQMAEAIAVMARQQLAFEQHIDTRFSTLDTHIAALAEDQDTITGRLDQAAAVVGSLLKRVGQVEGLMAPGQVISETQAAEISALVKAIATEMAERDKESDRKRRNPYQAVFGELYRRFRVSSYHNVPAGKFADVMAWLIEYHGAVTVQGLPETPE